MLKNIYVHIYLHSFLFHTYAYVHIYLRINILNEDISIYARFKNK